MRKLWKIAAVVGIVAVLGAATIAAVAYAQDATTGSSAVWDFGQKVKEAIATALGISVEKYDATVTAAQKQVLAQAVTDGWLTQNQADQMQQRLDRAPGDDGPWMGTRGPGMNRGNGGMGRGFGVEGSIVAVAADKLGMTQQELMTQLRSGKSIADLAKDKGVDTQVISDAYLAQVKANLDAQVTNGRLTQKMADAMLEQVKQNLPAQLTSATLNDWGRGFGGNKSLLVTVAADKLGVTEAKLMEELRSGKSITDVAKDKGVDTQAIGDAYLAQLKTNLDTQVKAGTITQEKADATLAQAKTDLPADLTTTARNGFGCGHGRGPHGGPWDQAPEPPDLGGL